MEPVSKNPLFTESDKRSGRRILLQKVLRSSANVATRTLTNIPCYVTIIVHPFVRPFFRHSVSPSVHLFVRPSLCSSLRPYLRSPLRPSVVTPFVRPSFPPFVFPSVPPSVRPHSPLPVNRLLNLNCYTYIL